jgi:hypothetical protein
VRPGLVWGPEVGVTVIEGDHQKSGGYDFMNKFGKYSFQKYEQLYADS